MNLLRDIKDFHNKFGIMPNENIDFKLRFNRLLEELDEFDTAETPWDKLDAVVDAVYIAVGTMYLYGHEDNANHLSHFFNMPYLINVKVPGPELNPTLPDLKWMVVDRNTDDHAIGCWWLAGSLLQWSALNRWNFPEAWKRVQAANMAKVRASSAAESKHGSTQDIIKPAGWTAPCHRDLFEGAK